MNLTQKLIRSHLTGGIMNAGEEIGIKIDQCLLQDATGTLVMLTLEAMGLDRAKTEIAVQYVDHNILQTDFKNADDHLFLQSAAKKFGIWYSRPGNGISHAVHMDRFGIPGKTLLGSDSHTCAAGALGMLAIGAGGSDVAMALAGEPFYFKMPKVTAVELTGKLPDWVSAKDVILELLRRRGVAGGRGHVFEYCGDGLKDLRAMDRHVIANMGAELGATSSVFPSDAQTRRYLESQGRGSDWLELTADENAIYDETERIDLSGLEPLIAEPSSPGKVVKVREVAGRLIHQVVIGSSANPGLRDFWVAAKIVENRSVHPRVSLDLNPTSRQLVENLAATGALAAAVRAGARFHQAGCLGCIGMGQAPGSGKISLRTMPRNFPGRSGTLDDQVYLCSPETGAASALRGEITDPRDLEKIYGMPYPRYSGTATEIVNDQMLNAPSEGPFEGSLERGPNIKLIPKLEPVPDDFEIPVLLKLKDDVSTDEILKAGTEVLPYRSNIPEISKWCYKAFDGRFYERALRAREEYGGFAVVGGQNYAQGSSREHAALAPRYLGQWLVLAKSYARIAWQNLVNFGIVPFEFADALDYDRISQDDVLRIRGLRTALERAQSIEVQNLSFKKSFWLKHALSPRQIRLILAGGVTNAYRGKRSGQ